MTPDPKLGTQGSWVRDPKNQVLFLPKPYRVGCPSIANRGRWVRFWNQFSCIDDPWPKTGYPGVMGLWPQKPSFVFAETISCWVSFYSKSGSLNPILKPVFLYRWPLTQNWVPRGHGFFGRELAKRSGASFDAVFCIMCSRPIPKAVFLIFSNFQFLPDSMQIRKKNLKFFFRRFMFFKNLELPRRTFWRRIRIWNPFFEIFLRWWDICQKWPNYAN